MSTISHENHKHKFNFDKDWPEGYWWDSDNSYVYFGLGKEILIAGSLYELFGSMDRKAIRHQIKVLEENKHMKWHNQSPLLDVLKNSDDKPLEIVI